MLQREGAKLGCGLGVGDQWVWGVYVSVGVGSPPNAY